MQTNKLQDNLLETQ